MGFRGQRRMVPFSQLSKAPVLQPRMGPASQQCMGLTLPPLQVAKTPLHTPLWSGLFLLPGMVLALY